MLTSLSIKNYALIDDLNMSFNKGLSIITGETGAGKSILLGGLSLVLGKRADLSAIKDSTKKCIIEGVFEISNYQLEDIFEENDLDFEKNTILRREILPSGKSRAFINDTPVTLQVLQELGSKLLDIHSQHQTLELTNDDFQFQLLDALANNKDLLSSYAENLEGYRKLRKDLESLQNKRSELIKEYDYNSFLLNELLEAKLEYLNVAELEEEMETLSNVEMIQERLGSAYQIINDDEIGVTHSIKEIKQQLAKIASFKKDYQQIYERIESVSIEVDDIQAELEEFQGNLEMDPNRLEVINSQLAIINNLFHKHQVDDMVELIRIREELDTKVSDSDDMDSKINSLLKHIEGEKMKLIEKATEIHKRREQIIPELTSKLDEILEKLGMPNSRFKIEVSQSESFFLNGMDDLDFLFSANKGGNFNELKKAASGGELSRIMLAIKFIISKYIHLPTIMLDEIDTGVSGEISKKMANIMQDMSKTMQVFSITHLPQIAAKGDFHYKVYKKVVDESTNTYLKKLDNDERIVEIAEMLGGSKLSNSAIAHAKELLN
ncbi:DNA replication and repair protein RecN [Flavobacteriaceae bacterium MAR_2010_188]|nr:DNA replication and repair protein RecN [Flavobacteriaceae bacterium MAR_2010_188]